MRTGEEHFPVPDKDIGLGQLGAACAQGFHFPSGKLEASLVAILDEILVACLAVFRDQRLALVLAFICHAAL